MDAPTLPLDKNAYLEGQMLLIDKPYAWSSFQALNAVRWTLRRAFSLKKIKVGHAGTLDPLATGLLILCTGKSTRRISDLQGMPKEYTGTFHLGATTPSYDLETEPSQQLPVNHLTPEMLEAAARSLTGEIVQQPPVFSAIKKDGKRLYEYARSGHDVEVPLRQVHIEAFEITRIALPEVDFCVRCSKGTYIRSLAYDFGQALGTGAYLSALRRTKIGAYTVNKAFTPDAFKAAFRDAGFEV